MRPSMAFSSKSTALSTSASLTISGGTSRRTRSPAGTVRSPACIAAPHSAPALKPHSSVSSIPRIKPQPRTWEGGACPAGLSMSLHGNRGDPRVLTDRHRTRDLERGGLSARRDGSRAGERGSPRTSFTHPSFSDLVVLNSLEHRIRGSAGERVAAVRGSVHACETGIGEGRCLVPMKKACAHGSHNQSTAARRPFAPSGGVGCAARTRLKHVARVLAEHGSDRHTTTKRLGRGEDINVDAKYLVAPELARAAHAGLDLVHHEQGVVLRVGTEEAYCAQDSSATTVSMCPNASRCTRAPTCLWRRVGWAHLVAELPCGLEELHGARPYAALSLEGLEHDGREPRRGRANRQNLRLGQLGY
eukprot:scaffold59015_cov31-Tisochrysis_lutea.AAC.7